jgi:hypothetical protein
MRTNNEMTNRRRQAALQTLQTAIVRLASKPAANPAAQQRVEINALVEQALDAYRKYMEVIA